MRSTIRLFMAAILFIAAAGLVSAQDPAPAPPAPEVAKPAELPPLPVADPNAQAVAPAPTADQTAPPVEPALTLGPDALAVETAAPATVEQPVAEKPVATTTKRVTKKTATKPVAKPETKPETQSAESFKEAAPAAGTADTTASLPPPQAPAASVKSIAPAPAAADTVAVEESKSQTTMGIGGWLLAGIAIAGLAVIISKIRSRRTKKRTSIVDFTTISPELKGPASL
jgi:outer membrane biosynthesis protein TonB